MIVLYVLAAGVSNWVAGLATLRGWWGQVQPRYPIAFVAGTLLGTTFFHILPELNLETDGLFLAAGFVVFYALEKLMMIHACGEKECEIHRIGPIAVFGMALDNVVDGAGMVAGQNVAPLLGLSIAVAVVLHEVPQGVASALIMQEAGWSRRKSLSALAFAGLLYPLGALISGGMSAELQRRLLAFVAGDFIYLGAADMLPEAHRRFNGQVVLAVVLGFLFMGALKAFLP